MASLSPDLILTNGRVITLDPFHPHARTVEISAGTIVSVSNGNIRKEQVVGTEVIDCRGGVILPGFIDAHCHLHAYAVSLVNLNLEPRNNIRSISNIQNAVHQLSLSLSAGTWITGRGYDEFHLAEKRHPTRWDLDIAASANPVKISHRSGYAHVLNSLALTLANITATTPDPPDGIIERDYATGEPTGLLYNMGDYLSEKVPSLSDDELRKGIKKANESLLAAGITSLQDASSVNSRKDWLVFERWKKEGLLLPRVRMMIGFSSLKDYRNEVFSSFLPKKELAAGGVKIIIHETTGTLLPEQKDLNEMVLEIHRLGLQAVLHAVEEEGIKAACTAIEYALKKHPRTNHRHRIEHCAICPHALAKRLASSGMMVVTQPSFIFYHGERYVKTVPPEQLFHLYPLATLFNEGVVVSASSDFPVAPPNPLVGIYAAMSRKSETKGIILPGECISPSQAILLYTKHAALSAFEEHEKGSITPGNVADLVVLNGDPLSLDPEEIREIKVRMTIINGQIVWESGECRTG